MLNKRRFCKINCPAKSISRWQLTIWLILSLFMNGAQAQFAIKNGVGIPASDTLMVLVVFADVNYDEGPCPSNLPDNIKGSWTINSRSETMLPSYADSFYDPRILAGKPLKGYITDYYHQASFGKYVLLGDYYPKVITLPCNKVHIGSDGLQQILTALHEDYLQNPAMKTRHGFELKDFDNWTPTQSGLPKKKEADGRIDLLYIIWKNNRFLTGPNTIDNSGYGVNAAHGKPFATMHGVNNVTSFNAGHSQNGAFQITISEHLHGIFGGNNWHSAGGRGDHTFITIPYNYGLTGQAFATMNATSGWDRWMMDWKNPSKKFLISALDNSGKEIDTENISIENSPEEIILRLRDFIATGDAVRIKLPYVDFKKPGDPKNQYLWLENRRMKTNYDKYLNSKCSENNNGEFLRGTPGMYAYIQVGKDEKEGGNNIYSSSFEQPNGLASPFMPLSAEGNFDFHYRYDKIQEGSWDIDCNWNNRNLPVDKSRSIPNPFTGFSDLYKCLDYNNDGKLLSGDDVEIGLAEWKGDTIIHNYNRNGDWKDAYGYATGKTRLSMSTNPAPVPVYTLTTNYEYKKFHLREKKPLPFENRTIWLSGLSIEIIDENDKTGDMTIKIRWDNYSIDNDVRWCGNIVLNPNHVNKSKPSLILEKRVKIHLDQGLSATLPEGSAKNKRGEWLMAESTTLNCKKDSYIYMNENSKLIIDNGSELILEKGSKLFMDKKAKIISRNGGKLTLIYGAEIIRNPKSQIKIK